MDPRYEHENLNEQSSNDQSTIPHLVRSSSSEVSTFLKSILLKFGTRLKEPIKVIELHTKVRINTHVARTSVLS